MKKLKVRWKPLLIILILFLAWLLCPSAATVTGINEYEDSITRIELIPRPGSSDPKIELTTQEEIDEILHWFSSRKVRPAFNLGAGSMVAVRFFTETGETLRIDVKDFGLGVFYVSGPLGPDSKRCALLRPSWLDPFWKTQLGW